MRRVLSLPNMLSIIAKAVQRLEEPESEILHLVQAQKLFQLLDGSKDNHHFKCFILFHKKLTEGISNRTIMPKTNSFPSTPELVYWEESGSKDSNSVSHYYTSYPSPYTENCPSHFLLATPLPNPFFSFPLPLLHKIHDLQPRQEFSCCLTIVLCAPESHASLSPQYASSQALPTYDLCPHTPTFTWRQEHPDVLEVNDYFLLFSGIDPLLRLISQSTLRIWSLSILGSSWQLFRYLHISSTSHLSGTDSPWDINILWK